MRGQTAGALNFELYETQCNSLRLSAQHGIPYSGRCFDASGKRSLKPEVKNNRKIKIACTESGCSCSRKVVS